MSGRQYIFAAVALFLLLCGVFDVPGILPRPQVLIGGVGLGLMAAAAFVASAKGNAARTDPRFWPFTLMFGGLALLGVTWFLWPRGTVQSAYLVAACLVLPLLAWLLVAVFRAWRT